MAAATDPDYHPAVGDIVELDGHRVGDTKRLAEVLEVLGGPGHYRYRVRWEDGHESIFLPGSDATLRRRDSHAAH
jgi:Domain of unknown function (DUF1918)